jgi:hypothetical protein
LNLLSLFYLSLLLLLLLLRLVRYKYTYLYAEIHFSRYDRTRTKNELSGWLVWLNKGKPIVQLFNTHCPLLLLLLFVLLGIGLFGYLHIFVFSTGPLRQAIGLPTDDHG